jgi:hypothetical protein
VLSDEIVGAAALPTVKTTAFELTVVPVVLPGFVTVITKIPAVARSIAGMTAVRLVELL